MADRSHLTPVPTTDKRGRVTTVYRNLDRSAGQRRGLTSVPAAEVARTAPVGPTPLPEGTPRTPEELGEFGRLITRKLEKVFGNPELKPAEWTMDPTGLPAAALAMDLRETKALGLKDIALLLRLSEDGTIGGVACDVLRIAAHPRLHEAKKRQDPLYWRYDIVEAVRGLRRGDYSALPRITTVEELEASAAVVQFLVAMSPTQDTSLVIEVHDGPRSLTGMRLRSPHFEALLRQRPRDIDVIVGYVTERGMDPDSSDSVEDLRKWLDSDTRAVADGWL